MANSNGKTNDPDWQGFANIRLESHHRKAIKAFAESLTGDDVWGYILECLDEDYKVSFSPDYENDAIIVTLTGQGANGNPNAGYAMSQRHSDPGVAVAASLFAHREIAQRGMWIEHEYNWRDVEW
jgi:hypothetical protein